MTKKKTTASRARRRRAPEFKFTGSIASVIGPWHAIFFEHDDDGVDEETITTLPVACWAACVKGNDPLVGGMVAGANGLELAELDASFRGYIAADNEEAHEAFVTTWEQENGYEDEDDGDDEDDEDDEG